MNYLKTFLRRVAPQNSLLNNCPLPIRGVKNASLGGVPPSVLPDANTVRFEWRGAFFAVGLLVTLLTGCQTKKADQIAAVAPLPASVKRPVTAGVAPAAPTVNPALAHLKPKAAQFIFSRDKTRVALTFDAGSDDRAVMPILKQLKSRNVRATFFLTGKFCEQFPKSCRAIADAGMEIGNHSYSHPHFPRLTDAQIRAQLVRGEAAITKACGRGAKPLFRFPYGDFSAHACKVVADAGFQPIYWRVDSLDAFGPRKSAAFVTDRINSRIRGGDVALMHVSSTGSAAALPQIFARLDKIKARPVPVSEMLERRR